MKMLDLSKFEKIAEDKHTTTMKHKDGHTMTILVAQLPKIHREQLKRLKMAEGGKVKNYDEGTPDDPVSADPGASAETSPPTQFPDAEALAAQPQPSAVLPTNLGNPSNAADVPAEAVGLTGQAADLQTQVDSAAGKGKLAIAQEEQRNAQDVLDRQNQSIADMKKHTDDLAQWTRENPQDSAQYWNKMSDGQKSQTALGLFLGGLGGGGTSNVALDYLNKNIDRNVADQKENYQRERNVFGAYQALYGDENVSTALTKVSLNDKILADADRLTAKLATPQAAKANALLKANTLKENADLLQKAAFIRNAPKGGSETNPSQPQQLPGTAAPGEKTIKYGPDSADSTGAYNIQPILKPGAAQIMDQYARKAVGDPAAAAQLPKIQSQYESAAKADSVLAQAKEIFEKLKENATPGGWVGRQVEKSDLSSVPVVGGALNAAGHIAGDAFTGARKGLGIPGEGNDEFEQERDYNIYAQKLSDLFSSVYKGIGSENLKSKLSGMLPEQTDTPENLTNRMKAFEDLIKSSQEKNVIQNAGMAN